MFLSSKTIIHQLKSNIQLVISRKFSGKMRPKIPAAVIQCAVSTDRDKNLINAQRLVAKAKSEGARLVVLPECFNSPYGTKFFKDYAEKVCEGPTCKMLSSAAKEHEIYLVGGTFPEVDGDALYNTCTVWNPTGELIAKYRKMHLFDIDIPGGITFKESDVLKAGNELAIFEIDGVKVGLGICYDIRFEELAKIYRQRGCDLLIYPGAFNMTTGPLHWELLQRVRAVDNQVFVFAVSPARSDKGYVAWGHSQITDPWGKIMVKAGYEEEIISATLDFNECDKIRQQIPVFSQRRTDIYDTIVKK